MKPIIVRAKRVARIDIAFEDSLGALSSPLLRPFSMLLMTGSLIRAVPMKPVFPSGLGVGADVTGDGVRYRLGASVSIEGGSEELMLGLSVIANEGLELALSDGLGVGADVTGDGVGYRLGASVSIEGGSEELMLGLSVVANEGLELALSDG